MIINVLYFFLFQISADALVKPHGPCCANAVVFLLVSKHQLRLLVPMALPSSLTCYGELGDLMIEACKKPEYIHFCSCIDEILSLFVMVNVSRMYVFSKHKSINDCFELPNCR